MKYDVEKAGYILLGRCGESYARTVEIDVSSYLAEYPDGVVTLLHRRHGEETIYPVATEIADGCLVWKPSSADTACVGDGAAEVRVTVDDVVVKSKMLCTVVEKSLTGQETDTPEASKDWVDKVLEKVGDMTEVKAEAESVEYGQPAKAEYDKETGTLKLSIPEGKPGADGQNGSQGPKGEQGPQGEPGKDGSDADVTAENIQSALGYAPVKDVQVAGTSVLADGVAGIPMAAIGKAGVTYCYNPWVGGLYIATDGSIRIIEAPTTDIDTRATAPRPITGNNLDYAVKAAMCDGKGAAWTSAEQTAARSRMGLDKPYELIEEITTDGESIIERTQEPDGTPYNFVAVRVAVTSPKNLSDEKTIYARIFYGANGTGTYSMYRSNSDYFWRATYTWKKENGIIMGSATEPTIIYADQDKNGGDYANARMIPDTFFTDEIFTKLRVYLANSAPLPAGFLIQIYGVRA